LRYKRYQRNISYSVSEKRQHLGSSKMNNAACCPFGLAGGIVCHLKKAASMSMHGTILTMLKRYM
jgi:hypothetical protein